MAYLNLIYKSAAGPVRRNPCNKGSLPWGTLSRGSLSWRTPVMWITAMRDSCHEEPLPWGTPQENLTYKLAPGPIKGDPCHMDPCHEGLLSRRVHAMRTLHKGLLPRGMLSHVGPLSGGYLSGVTNVMKEPCHGPLPWEPLSQVPLSRGTPAMRDSWHVGPFIRGHLSGVTPVTRDPCHEGL